MPRFFDQSGGHFGMRESLGSERATELMGIFSGNSGCVRSQVKDFRTACPREVRVGFIGNPDRSQIAGTMQSSQLKSVSAVVFDMNAFLRRRM